MTGQVIVYGSKVERSDDSGANWEAIPEVKSLAVPTVTQDYVDVTSLDSPGGFREYVKGLKDGGEVSVTVGYTAAGYAQQLADQALSGAIRYRVIITTQPGQTAGDVFEFSGYPTPSVENGEIGSAIEMTITIRTTGAMDWVKGA